MRSCKGNTSRSSFTAICALCPGAFSQTASSDVANHAESKPEKSENIVTRIVDRGQDFAVYENVTVQPDGTSATNRFTMLENGLHYRENGEWRESEDVIEAFPTGAIARKGPNRAIFSDELNVESVFDIEMSNGKRVRGGIRTIQATDFASGNTVVLGTVKQSVKAQLLPPNKILYASAFDGLEADLVLVWKHNLFSHDVVIRERPQLPPDWDPANVRLEVVTEFFTEAEPELRANPRKPENAPELRDNSAIHFGAMAMIMGKAFRLSGDDSSEIGSIAPGGAPVDRNGVNVAVSVALNSDLGPGEAALPNGDVIGVVVKPERLGSFMSRGIAIAVGFTRHPLDLRAEAVIVAGGKGDHHLVGAREGDATVEDQVSVVLEFEHRPGSEAKHGPVHIGRFNIVGLTGTITGLAGIWNDDEIEQIPFRTVINGGKPDRLGPGGVRWSCDRGEGGIACLWGEDASFGERKIL